MFVLCFSLLSLFQKLPGSIKGCPHLTMNNEEWGFLLGWEELVAGIGFLLSITCVVLQLLRT